MPERGVALEVGKGRIVKEGTKIALLSFGARLAECLKAAEELDARGLPTTVADARFAKPLDRDLILRLAREHQALITIEEGCGRRLWQPRPAPAGHRGHAGHGAARPADGAARHLHRPGQPAKMYDVAGLNAPQIVATALSALGQAEAAARA